MTHPLRFEGRRVTLRLSDLPIKVRQDAADQLINEEILSGSAPEDLLLTARALHAIAIDPVNASIELPGECQNKKFSVSEEAYFDVVLRAVA